MAEKLEELQLPRAPVELESRGAIYAVPLFEDPDLGKPSQTPEDTLGPLGHPTSVSSGHPTPPPLSPQPWPAPRQVLFQLGSSSLPRSIGDSGDCHGGARAGAHRAGTERRHKQRAEAAEGAQLTPAVPILPPGLGTGVLV